MIVSFMAAMSQNRVIGTNQKLPWHIPEDLKRFKQITEHHPVVMGRKTFDSIGKPLPKRPNIVITRQKIQIPNVKVVHSITEALEPYLSTQEEVFILGGGEIFKEALPLADRIYLTLIAKDYEGDAFFPVVDYRHYKVTFEEAHTEPVPYKFINYERVYGGGGPEPK